MRVPRPLRLGSLLVLLASLLIIPPAQATEFAQAEHEVAVDDFFFAPEELYVNAGDTVTWTWVGQEPHNVTPVEEGAFPASETQVEGTHQATFEAEGQVPYFCTLHAAPDGSEGMVGVVNVLAEGEPLPEPPPAPRPAPAPGQMPRAEDAVGISLSWSSLFADGGAQTVLLGRDDVFADSLASGALQGLLDAPLLLTPSDSLDQRIIDELTRLGTQTVIILGGENAITPDVEMQLRDSGYTVDRIAGDTRIETAIQVAQAHFADATSAFLVRADGTPGGDPTQGFADSLSVGGLAAAIGTPVLLSQTDQLSATTRAYLEQSQIRDVFVVGGVAALSEQVVADLEALGITVQRYDGATRFETSLNLAFGFLPGPPEVAILVDGQAPDAWVSGFTAASAAESSFIALSNGPDLPGPTAQLALNGIPVLCGPATDPAACEKAEIAASAASFGEPGVLGAVLAGDEEVPGPGAEGTTGAFNLYPTSADDAVCYDFFSYGFDEPLTGAHIHEGAEGESGPVVIPLDFQPDGFGGGCAFDLDPALVADIMANPAGYYVNLHTATFPDGAIRGQLRGADIIGVADLAPAPESEVAGGGFLFMFSDPADRSVLCYDVGIFLEGDTVTSVEVVAGTPEGPGSVVLDLPFDATTPEQVRCEEGFDPQTVEEVLAEPDGFHVLVSTEAHPDGALAGQLFNPFGGPPPGEEQPQGFASAWG